MKVLFALLMIATSLTASAQRRPVQGQGRIDIRGGHSTVRILVNERSSMEIRMRLLEEAVRDLQNQVYDLRDDARTQIVQVCTLNTPFSGSYIGKASGQIEASAIARNNCQRAGREAFCSSRTVTCESVEEVIGH